MSYQPTFPGEGATPTWLYDELQRIAQEMVRPVGLQFEVLHEEPPRPAEGLLVFADGTDWNPAGAGAGLHQYVGGVWDKL
jgi:hypothetical protein